jgi:hypothetical protein
MTAYELIQGWYGDKTTERSKVPLINHIDEGLKILKYLGAASYVKDAYCIHPIIQSDNDFKNNILMLHPLPSLALALAVEYRHVANAWLSDKVLTGPYKPFWKDEPRLSVIPEVNMMLIADKVQNYKDFCAHHKGKHERSAELETYFQRWFEVLDISDDLYGIFALVINGCPVPPLRGGSGGAAPEQTVVKTEDGTTITW